MGAVGLIDKWRLLQASLCDPDLSPAAKVVMGRLLFHLNVGSDQCTPSFETLARGAGMARRTAVRAVRELRDSGWVASGRSGSGSYRLAFDRAESRAEVGIERSLGGDETVPTARDETVPRLGTKWCSELGTKRSPKQGKREQGKGTQSLALDPDLFDRFWRAYPRRVGKDAAKAAFAKAIEKGRATAEDLIAGAERYAAERSTQDPTYTKHPTTWLNGGHWADEPARPQRPRGGALQHVLDGGYFDE